MLGPSQWLSRAYSRERRDGMIYSCATILGCVVWILNYDKVATLR